jgi:hypothetical protein
MFHRHFGRNLAAEGVFQTNLWLESTLLLSQNLIWRKKLDWDSIVINSSEMMDTRYYLLWYCIILRYLLANIIFASLHCKNQDLDSGEVGRWRGEGMGFDVSQWTVSCVTRLGIRWNNKIPQPRQRKRSLTCICSSEPFLLFLFRLSLCSSEPTKKRRTGSFREKSGGGEFNAEVWQQWQCIYKLGTERSKLCPP